MLPLMHYFAKDDNATKAIFEHVRNLLTVAALIAAGGWLTKRPAPDFAGWLAHVQGWAILLVAVYLEGILVTNARIRLTKAGYSGAARTSVWVVHLLFVFCGLLTYVSR
jgi:hypothetical protein